MAITKFSEIEIHRALKGMLAQHPKFPPTLGEFVELLEGRQVDFDAAFWRMIDNKPEGRAEKHVSAKIGFNLRRMADDKARREFKKLLSNAIERERRGELVLDEDLAGKALAKHSVKNANDLAREKASERGLNKPENFRSGSVFERIAKLGQGASA